MLSRRQFIFTGLAAPALSYLSLADAYAAIPKDVLVMVGQLDSISNLDPHVAFEGASVEVCSNVYQKLVDADGKNPGRVFPDLATSWTVDADSKVYTFTLRPDAKFSSGNPVTAEDVAYSLQRLIKLNKGPMFIIGQFGFTADNVDSKVQALDAKTVQITLDKSTPEGFVLNCLSSCAASVVDKKTVEKNASNGDMGAAWLSKTSAGSGQWVLQTWKPNESIIIGANPNNPPQTKIARIIYRHVADPSTQLMMLQKGDADMARTLSTKELEAIKSDPNYVLVSEPILRLRTLALNTTFEPFKHPKVWEAMKYAIDYEGLQKNVVPLTFRTHQSFLPIGLPGAISDQPFRRDVAKAKALLAEAGYPKGFDVTFEHYSIQPDADIAQVLQANFKDIGINIKLSSGEQRQILSKVRSRNYEMATGVWGADYLDPQTNASTYCYNTDNGDDSTNRTSLWRVSHQDPKMMALADQALNEKDTQTRLKLYGDLQRYFMHNVPIIVYLQAVDVSAMRKGINGFQIGPMTDLNRYANIIKS